MSETDLGALFSATTPEAQTPVPARDGPLDQLRLQLAVRGWAAPIALAKQSGTTSAELAGILTPLAREVETAAERYPGRWFLSVAARRREIALRSDDELRAATAKRLPDDGDDAVRAAFEIALVPDKPALSEIAPPVLVALGNVSDWMAPMRAPPYEPRAIASEIAARTLSDDLKRMTALPLVGAAHRAALDALTEFATKAPKDPLNLVYIYGGGGAGKTTLLAFLQRNLVARTPAVAVARIDFDEPTIEPTRLVTLNIALFEQLLRSVDEIGVRVPGLLDALRRTALVQRNAQRPSISGTGLPGGSKRAARGSNSAADSIASQAESDEGSLLYGLLQPDILRGPLVIIFDTAELVLSQSDSVASNLVAWIDFLSREAGATDVRLVIAGRDPPPGADGQDAGLAMRHLLARLASAGAAAADPIALPELTEAEAATLLRNCGVESEPVIAAAASAVPGNPLLLRITADALLQDEPTIREAVEQAHRDSRIAPDNARRYLIRRIVAHVSDPVARPYVLAALYAPFLSQALLEQVIIPAVDRNAVERAAALPHTPALNEKEARAAREKAMRVFRALSGTYWLVRPTLDPKAIPFNRDIRSLVLKLMAATPESAVLERDLRQAAAIFHLRRRSARDKALALYHLALLGERYTLPRDRAGTYALLQDVREELPARLADWLSEGDPVVPTIVEAVGNAAGVSGVVATSGPAHSDAEWQRYLEGDGDREGEGIKLVRDDNAREAIDLYRSRPTRPDGMPPTFVIRAIADLGDWDGDEVNIKAILDIESKAWRTAKALDPAALSRIYWLTRLALQAGNGQLSAEHIEVLAAVSGIATGPGLSTLPALIAVAEAPVRTSIMSSRMRDNMLATDAAGRGWLTHSLPDRTGTLQLLDASLAVTQTDWWKRVSRMGKALDVSRLQWIQPELDALQGQPIATVNQLFDRVRERSVIRVKELSHADMVLLMRGLTEEFHRPLREALLTICGDGKAGPVTRSVVEPVLKQMTIKPVEMVPETFYARLETNPRAWATALVTYADRCRLLPTLCSRLQDEAGAGAKRKAARIAQSFSAWDRAICGRVPSEWNPK